MGNYFCYGIFQSVANIRGQNQLVKEFTLLRCLNMDTNEEFTRKTDFSIDFITHFGTVLR